MKYFTIEELCRSDTAKKRGIKNEPTEKVKSAMVRLIEEVLDPLRSAYGAPITVNSGYRCADLNRAVGGVKTSQHLKGEAADITVGNKAGNKRLFDLAIKLDLPYDQLIDEYEYSWVHISFSEGYVRHQIIHKR